MTAKSAQSSESGRSGSGGVWSRDGFASRRPRVRAPHAPSPSKCRFCRAFLAFVALLGNAGASAVRADLGRQGARRRQVRSTEVRRSRVRSGQTPRSRTPEVTQLDPNRPQRGQRFTVTTACTRAFTSMTCLSPELGVAVSAACVSLRRRARMGRACLRTGRARPRIRGVHALRLHPQGSGIRGR